MSEWSINKIIVIICLIFPSLYILLKLDIQPLVFAASVIGTIFFFTNFIDAPQQQEQQPQQPQYVSTPRVEQPAQKLPDFNPTKPAWEQNPRAFQHEPPRRPF